MSVFHPKEGEPVTGTCIFCGREARDGETYGTEDHHWDHSNTCPECWDDQFLDEEDDYASEQKEFQFSTEELWGPRWSYDEEVIDLSAYVPKGDDDERAT